jgi:phosphohistidine phosphatase SixA
MIVVAVSLLACTKHEKPEENSASNDLPPAGSSGDTSALGRYVDDTSTLIFVVRHGEKASNTTDPDLSVEGQARAEELKKLLSPLTISGAWATPFKRTAQTITPLANEEGVSITTYAPNLPTSALRSQLLQAFPKKIAVVAGHSNTVPDILKAFDSTQVVVIPDGQYDDLFLVKVSPSGMAKVLSFKYGVRTP